MLLAFFPATDVGSTISPHVNTLAVFLVVDVISDEESSVEPLVGALAVHHVFFPFSGVHAPVCPNVYAVACDDVVFPVTDVLVTVCPSVLSSALFSAVFVDASEGATVRPVLISYTFLLVGKPLALVLEPIRMLIDTEALSHVIDPLSVVDVSINVVELSAAMCLMVLPVSFILGAIRPELNAKAVAQIFFNLSSVGRPVLEDLFLLVLEAFFFEQPALVELAALHLLASYASFHASLNFDNFVHLFVVEVDLAVECHVLDSRVSLFLA